MAITERITVQFDGGSRGNPGPAGIGIVLRAEDGTPLVTLGRFIGRATNNVAEYHALIAALEKARELGAGRIIVRGDSELVIKQMRGEYRVKHPDLRPLHAKASLLLRSFEEALIEHNLRHHNTLADQMANLAMDRRRDVDQPPIDAPNASFEAPPPAPRESSPAAGARAGDQFVCPRCATAIDVIRGPREPLAGATTFTCQCGMKMRAKRVD